ncbi:MAG TPA: FkbM family methyltransferase [Chitinophagaceae bacterium]|nr:FkbM family methyltransferase [Chitinophagaceae bacterium]
MFDARGITKPSYLDIGAFHPFELSNTAKLYRKGSRGINIEPNPDQFHYFTKYRKNDQNLNIGVGDKQGRLLYYQMNASTLNTFDEKTAEELVGQHGFHITSKIELPVADLKYIITTYANNKFPDFLSLDTEGLDKAILEQIDFDNNYPKVICVETAEYSPDLSGRKNQELIDFLLGKDYILYADTYINSIFVKRKFWH